MGDAAGHRGYWGLAPQTVDRTTYAAAAHFAEIVSSGIHKVPDPTSDNLALINNSRGEVVEFLGNEPVNGPMQMPCVAGEALGYILKDLLPTENFTSLEAGSVGEHEFTPGAGFGIANGYSVEQSNDPTIANNVWKIIGVHTGQVQLSGDAGQPLMLDGTFDAYDMQSAGTDQSPVSYPDRLGFLRTNIGSADIGGASARIQNLQLTINPQLTIGRFNYGSPLADEQLPGVFQINGQVALRFANLTEVNNYLNNVGRSMAITVGSGKTIGAENLRLVIEISTLYWRGEVPKPTGTGEMMLTLPFRSKNGTYANLLKLTLYDERNSAYT